MHDGKEIYKKTGRVTNSIIPFFGREKKAQARFSGRMERINQEKRATLDGIRQTDKRAR
jgi:hypothetical protein